MGKKKTYRLKRRVTAVLLAIAMILPNCINFSKVNAEGDSSELTGALAAAWNAGDDKRLDVVLTVPEGAKNINIEAKVGEQALIGIDDGDGNSNTESFTIDGLKFLKDTEVKVVASAQKDVIEQQVFPEEQPKKDGDGNIIYKKQVKIDEETGEPVEDGEGNPIYEDVLDSEGNPVPETEIVNVEKDVTVTKDISIEPIVIKTVVDSFELTIDDIVMENLGTSNDVVIKLSDEYKDVCDLTKFASKFSIYLDGVGTGVKDNTIHEGEKSITISKGQYTGNTLYTGSVVKVVFDGADQDDVSKTLSKTVTNKSIVWNEGDISTTMRDDNVFVITANAETISEFSNTISVSYDGTEIIPEKSDDDKTYTYDLNNYFVDKNNSLNVTFGNDLENIVNPKDYVIKETTYWNLKIPVGVDVSVDKETKVKFVEGGCKVLKNADEIQYTILSQADKLFSALAFNDDNILSNVKLNADGKSYAIYKYTMASDSSINSETVDVTDIFKASGNEAVYPTIHYGLEFDRNSIPEYARDDAKFDVICEDEELKNYIKIADDSAYYVVNNTYANKKIGKDKDGSSFIIAFSLMDENGDYRELKRIENKIIIDDLFDLIEISFRNAETSADEPVSYAKDNGGCQKFFFKNNVIATVTIKDKAAAAHYRFILDSSSEAGIEIDNALISTEGRFEFAINAETSKTLSLAARGDEADANGRYGIMTFVVDSDPAVLESDPICENDIRSAEDPTEEEKSDIGHAAYSKKITFTVKDDDSNPEYMSGLKDVYITDSEKNKIEFSSTESDENDYFIFDKATGNCVLGLNKSSSAKQYYIAMVDNVGNVSYSAEPLSVGYITRIGLVSFGFYDFTDDSYAEAVKQDDTYYLNQNDKAEFSIKGEKVNLIDAMLISGETTIHLPAASIQNSSMVVKGKDDSEDIRTYSIVFNEDEIEGFADGKWSVAFVVSNAGHKLSYPEGAESDNSFTYDNTAPVVDDISIFDSVRDIVKTKSRVSDSESSITVVSDGRQSSYEKNIKVEYSDNNLQEYSYIVKYGKDGNTSKEGKEDNPGGIFEYKINKEDNKFGGISYYDRDIDIVVTDKAGNATTSKVEIGPVIEKPVISDFKANSNKNSGYVATAVGLALDEDGEPIDVIFSDGIEVKNLESSSLVKFKISSDEKTLEILETENTDGQGKINKTTKLEDDGRYTNIYELVLPREWEDGSIIGSNVGGESIKVEFIIYQDEQCTDFESSNKFAEEIRDCAVTIDNSIPTITFGNELIKSINEGTDSSYPRKGYIYNDVKWGVNVNATANSIEAIKPDVDVDKGPKAQELVENFTYNKTGIWKEIDQNINSDQYEIDKEGIYNVSLTATNKAGTTANNSVAFIYDKTKPEDRGYTVSSRYDNNYSDYQFIDQKPLEVKMDVYDGVSGIRSVEVKQGKVKIPAKVIDGSVYDSINGDSNNTIKGIIFNILPTYKGQINVDVTDEAFNVTHYTINKDLIAGVISEGNDVDDSRITLTTNYKSEKVFDNVEYYGLSDNPVITINAADDISGIRKIVMKNRISGPTVNDKTYDQYTKQDKTTNSVNDEKYALNLTEGEYEFVAELEDNSGKKTSSTTRRMIIDRTPPTISTNIKSVAKEYQNTDVNVSVTIEEKYLNEATTVIKIFNNDSLERTITGGGNQQVSFSSDGKYYFTVETTDKAGNQSEVYNSKTDFGGDFTVDKTSPKLSISYDNNDVANGKYYKNARIATLTVEEHNFDASGVSILINGAAFNAVFSDNGDIHRASIPFSEENDYSLSIKAIDKAGNSEVSAISDEFTVDLTDPEITITNVEEDMIYSDTIAPAISITDKNYDSSASIVNITSNRAEAGGENAKKSVNVTRIANGEQWNYENFQKIDGNDDYYVIDVSATDLSGRTSTETIAFKVDRFGSYFVLGTYTQKVVDNVYTNLEGNDDLTIEEYNLADIDSREVYFTVGEDTVKLSEKDGYTIKSSVNDAHYNVNVYTFDKTKFDREGEYEIVVSTKDSEGNTSDNASKNAAAKFVIDRTAPEYAISNVEDGQNYEQDSITAVIDVYDNIAIYSAKISIDGSVTEYSAKDLSNLNNQISVDFESGEHTISVEVTDAAGNNTVGEEIKFSLYKNAVEKALDIDTTTGKRNWLIIGGIVLVVFASSAILIIAAKRRKKDNR